MSERERESEAERHGQSLGPRKRERNSWIVKARRVILCPVYRKNYKDGQCILITMIK